MEFNYLYGKQAEQFAYVNIPKALIHEEAFSDVSLEAKMLYGLIMERMGMYRKNKWQDEQGRVYVLYPVKEIMEDMNRSEASVSKYLSELEEARLLERVQSVPGRPCKLYLKKLSYVYIELRLMVQWNEKSIEKSVKDCNRDKMCSIYYS